MSLDSSKMNFKNKFFNNSTSTDNINKEEYLIQKDVLHMINNFVETDDIKSGTYSPYKSIKHELNSFSDDLKDKVKEAGIHTEILGSDHCPVSLVLDI